MNGLRDAAHGRAGVLGLLAVLAMIVGVGVGPAGAASQGTGTIIVRKVVVDMAGAVIPDGQVSNHDFNLFANDFAATERTDRAGVATFRNLAPGRYGLQENPDPASGLTLQAFVLGGRTFMESVTVEVAAGATVEVTARNRPKTVAEAPTGDIVITKSIVDGSGATVAGADVSGYTFTLTPTAPAGMPITSGPTGMFGGAVFENLPPNIYLFNEVERADCRLRDALVNDARATGRDIPIRLNPGQTITIVANNACGAAATGAATGQGTVAITKNVVDANGGVVAGADRSGFTFGFGLVTGPSVRSPDFLFTTTAAGTTSATLAPGTYRLYELPRGECTVRGVRIGGMAVGGPNLRVTASESTVEFTIGAGQSVAIEVNNTCPAAGMAMMPAGPTRSDRLIAGCNNVALTFPAGTPLRTVAQGVSESAGLLSIFRLNPGTARFLGFAAAAPDFANDYTMVGARLEAVFICVRAPGTLTQPEV